MPITIACPSKGILDSFLVGRLSVTEVEQLSSHVMECAKCTAYLSASTVKDPVVEALKNPGSAATQRADPLVKSLISEVSGWQVATETPFVNETTETFDPVKQGDPKPSFEFLAPPQSADELGRLGSYRVLELLGTGGMGMVFKAEDPHLKRMIALKVLKPALAVMDVCRERFRREAQAAAHLQHDNIVPIYQVGEDRGTPFLTMPLLSGKSLDDLLKKAGKVNVTATIQFGIQMAKGLKAAHERGLIHRDIKPGNIWIESVQGGRVKILDFGLARTAGDEASRLTQSGAVVGTPLYMAPEQANDQPTDHRCDLYSLGCILYQMCTGTLPFRGNSLLAILSSMANAVPTHPDKLNPKVPRELSDLIMKLLAREPAQRIGSADEVIRILKQLQEKLKVKAPTKPKINASLTEKWRSAPKSVKYIAAALIALVLLGAAGLMYQIFFRTENGTLIVEVDQDADVRFQKGELRIHDSAGKLLYSLKPSEKNKKLPPGKYLLEVVGADGVRLETDKFEIVKNGEAKVRVTVDTGTLTAKSDDAERKATEWVLSMDGTIGINEVGTEKFQLFTSAKGLPAGPLLITSAHLPGDRVTSADLQRLQPLANLTFLSVHSQSVKDEGLAHLKPLTKLRELQLPFCKLTDAGLVHLKAFPELWQLGLNSPQITDDGLRHLRDLPKLGLLFLGGTATGDKVLELVQALPMLSQFSPGTNFTDDGLKRLRSLRPELQVLSLQSTKVTDAGLVHLKGWNSLLSLDFYGSGFADAGLEHLAELPKLINLGLSGTKVTDAGMAHLKRSKSIETLVLSNTGITDAGLEHLGGVKSLKWVGLKGTSVTAAGVAALHKALPNCKIEWDGGTIEPNAPADRERRAIEWVLSIGGKIKLFPGHREIASIKDFPGGSYEKVSIVFDSNNQLTDAGLENLTKISKLDALTIRYCPVSAVGLAHLKSITTLKWLFLAGIVMDDATVGILKTMTNLTWLGLDDTPVSDSQVAHLKSLTKLWRLSLNQTKGTTADGVAALHKALPGCMIEWDGGTVKPTKPADDKSPPGEWVSLFNGKDLAGWKVPQLPGKWQVEKGILTGSGGHTYLFTERNDYNNFHARMKVRINAAGNSGLFFRTPWEQKDDRPQGYEAQIYHDQAPYRTGSLYGLCPTDKDIKMPAADEWFVLEVIAQDNHIIIKVNGKTSVDFLDAGRRSRSGHLSIQCHDRNTIVQVESIEVKRLSSGLIGSVREMSNCLGMKLVYIPPGKFMMGSSKEEIERCQALADDWQKQYIASEGPAHPVEITHPYYLGTTKVTVGQFRKFLEANPNYAVGDERWQKPGFEQSEDHPVIYITWQNAIDFCDWLSKKEGKKYRLPTEAEWEYACRAGKDGMLYSFGNDVAQLEHYAWFGDIGAAPGTNVRKAAVLGTKAVGKKEPNGWGLYDVHGNAYEWCQDFYDPAYYQSTPTKDPQGGTGTEHVCRGGAWDIAPVHCRSAHRLHYKPDMRGFISFRLVLEAPAAGKRGEFVMIPIDKAATAVSTQGMFYKKEGERERLVLADWREKMVKGVPFRLVDPRGDRIPNVIVLYGPQGELASTMPKWAKLSCGAPAAAIHLLSGISGWGFPFTAEKTVAMIVRLHYADGQTEDHELVNGEHFAEYMERVDVPKSEFAFSAQGGQQVRYLAIRPKRTATIAEIEFRKGTDVTAPVVMAVTVEKPRTDGQPIDKAQPPSDAGHKE